MGAKRQPPAVPQGQPPRPVPTDGQFFVGGSRDFDERTGKYRSTGTRRPPRRGDAPPGFVRGPNDKLIPIKKRGGFGIGGGPGIPPKFPAGDFDDPRMIPINPNRPRYKKGSDRLIPRRGDAPPGFVRGPNDKLIPIKGGRKRPSGPRLPGGCPDPNMFILMSDGTQKKAGDLKVGDLIKTNHEETLELGEYKVEYVNILENVEKIKLIFDESVIICSLTHKFYVDDSWKEAKDMVIGDEVSDKKLLSIESVEDGDVVHITVEDAHTYICEGLLSHNKRFAPNDPRRGGGRRSDPKRLPPSVMERLCPDPNMHILMADDSQKKAGDLTVGDLVKTYHEESFELGNYEVEQVEIINNVKKIKLIFDKNTIICSLSHKFYVVDSWKEAKDMVIGDVVSNNKLVAIESVEDGDVVRISIKDAHTYICEGLLSHNKSIRRPVVRRPVGRRGGPRVPLGPDGRPVSDPTLGGPPEREVPIPKERIRPITRESDPRGGAPFGPDERAMARDRFFERMFERADERRQQGSMEREERREVRRARMDERRARRDEPGEIDVGGEIDINAERGGRRRRRRRDFTRRRSGMERRRSREERAAFRNRYVSTMR